MRSDNEVKAAQLSEINLTDTVYVFADGEWKKVVVVAKPYPNKIIVSSIGPAVPLHLVLTEIDYTWLKKRNELDTYTQSLKL